jgi:hypothetical protein
VEPGCLGLRQHLLRRPEAGTKSRLVRYGSVSAISTISSLAVLGVPVGVIGGPSVWANVMATIPERSPYAG